MTVGYDDSVIEARAEADRLGKKRKVMYIQDTTLDNYWDIPLKIMQGYMTILVEAWNVGNLDDPANIPTHVFLQVSAFLRYFSRNNLDKCALHVIFDA
jgi:diaminopropionate ammonia-lyase